MDFQKTDGILSLRSESVGFEVIFLTRKCGFSNAPYDSLNMSYACGDAAEPVDRNHAAIFSAFSLEPDNLISLNQTHRDDVLIMRKGAHSRQRIGGYDAAVTDDPGLCLSILTADCVPLFLYDDKKRVFSAVHAGWRGGALGIAKKAVAVMRDEFACDMSDISAAIGPAIGACCFEIKRDVLEKLNASVAGRVEGLYREADGKLFADLIKYIKVQLIDTGIAEDSVHTSGHCTSCEGELFFSYRRENVTGRQLSFIRAK